MKLEYTIIAAMGLLIALTLVLIFAQQDASVLIHLEQINRQAKDAKAAGNEAELLQYKSAMREKIILVASRELGVPVTDVYLEDGFNFPLADASEVRIPKNTPWEMMPVCDIIPKISTHLQKARQTEMFLLFMKKYGGHPMEITIQDERSYRSTVHYTLAAKSGNLSASTFFHVNSCTDEIDADYYNLHCYDREKDEHAHAMYKDVIFASLYSDEFCMIEFEPWRQALFDYGRGIGNELKKHLQSLPEKERLDHKTMEEFHYEVQRLTDLGKLVAYVASDEFESVRMWEMIEDYKSRFGQIPEEFLELVDREKPL